MIDRFLSKFSVDSCGNKLSPKKKTGYFSCDDPEIINFLNKFGGCSFNNGLYRIVSLNDLETWVEYVGSAFPDFKEKVTCFGYDWLGRVFSVSKDNKEKILMFEPGTAEVLEIPRNIISFHNVELINYGDAALAEDFFLTWRKHEKFKIEYTQCVSYRKPLFLGGQDEINNLYIEDIDVCWSILAQILQKTKKNI